MERLQEKSVQAALDHYYASKGYAVKREVKTPVGYIDFLLYRNNGLSDREKILIEVKEFKGIKGAIGQVESYKKYHSDVTDSRVVYFFRDGKFRTLDASFEITAMQNSMKFECVHNFISSEELYKWQRRVQYKKSLPKHLTTTTSAVQISDESLEQILTRTEKSLQSEMGSMYYPREMVDHLSW